MLTLLSKVWFELWQDKTRTIQVMLVIALGAIGVGLVIGGRNLVAGVVAETGKRRSHHTSGSALIRRWIVSRWIGWPVSMGWPKWKVSTMPPLNGDLLAVRRGKPAPLNRVKIFSSRK
jgi:hypothetical protein